MTDRWVCARCFTSAEESATACPNCGLPRGTAPESAAADNTPAPEELTSVQPPSPASEVAPARPPATPALGAEERWVCLRCFSSNDGWRTACANCGEARNAGAAGEAGDTRTAGAPAAPAGGTGRQVPWRLVIYGVIALVVIGGSAIFAARRGDSGEITGAGDLNVFDLQVGDCFDVASDSSEIDTVRAVPCSEPHVYEMFWSGDYPSDVQPSETEYLSWLEAKCLPEFATYVGLEYADSAFYMGSLSPTAESWGDGDRSFSCYLHNDSETPISGSARGAAR